MSFFGTIKNAVTGPFRGIGYLAQGKIRKAVGAFGDTAKVAVPVAVGLTGVGVPAALAMGAGAGAADSWGHGENNIGKIAGSAAKGSATAGVARGIGQLARGVKLPMFGGNGVPASTGIDATGQAGIDAAGAAARSLPKLPGSSPLSALGKFAMKNPAVAAQAISLPLDAYSSAQQGNADDRYLDLQEKTEADRVAEQERRDRMDQLQMMMTGISNMRPRY